MHIHLLVRIDIFIIKYCITRGELKDIVLKASIHSVIHKCIVIKMQDLSIDIYNIYNNSIFLMPNFEGCVSVFCILPGILFCEISFIYKIAKLDLYMCMDVCVCVVNSDSRIIVVTLTL